MAPRAAVLRAATPADAEAIARLHTDSWRRTYRGMMTDDFLDGPALENRRATWRQRLQSPRPNQYVCVAVADATIVGFICGFADADPVWGSYIDNLHVDSRMQGRGIGRALMHAAADWLRESQPDRGMWLWVMEANTSARAFYERLGAANAETVNLQDPGGGYAPNCRYVWSGPRSLLP